MAGKISEDTVATDLVAAVIPIVQGGSNKQAPESLFGNIRGSAGATDNRLLRSDGTGGATVQASAVNVDDSGNMSGVGTLAAGVTTLTGASPLMVVYADDSASPGPTAVYRRVSASPAASDALGRFLFNGYNSLGVETAYGLMRSTIVDPTSGSEDGTFDFWTTIAGSLAQRAIIGGGIYHPSATGGDKGNNTINFGAVYDDNTLLTCMALQEEFIENGTVDLDKWDAFAPDLVVPEHVQQLPVTERVEQLVDVKTADGSIVRKVVAVDVPAMDWVGVWDEEGNGVDAALVPIIDEIVVPEQTITREHRTARLFKAMVEDGFDPRDPEAYFAKMTADEALPGMPTKGDWQQNDLSMGELYNRKWLAMEMLAIVCHVMWGKLQDHEARLVALEATP